MKLLDRLLGRRKGETMNTDREKQVRQIAQDSEETVKHAKEVLRRPPALIELRRLDSRRPHGRAT